MEKGKPKTNKMSQKSEIIIFTHEIAQKSTVANTEKGPIINSRSSLIVC